MTPLPHKALPYALAAVFAAQSGCTHKPAAFTPTPAPAPAVSLPALPPPSRPVSYEKKEPSKALEDFVVVTCTEADAPVTLNLPLTLDATDNKFFIVAEDGDVVSGKDSALCVMTPRTAITKGDRLDVENSVPIVHKLGVECTTKLTEDETKFVVSGKLAVRVWEDGTGGLFIHVPPKGESVEKNGVVITQPPPQEEEDKISRMKFPMGGMRCTINPITSPALPTLKL